MSFHVGVYRVVSCRVVGKCNFYLSTLFILPFPRHKISLSTIIFHRCEFILFPQTLLLLSFCCPVHVLLGEHICRLNGLPPCSVLGWLVVVDYVGGDRRWKLGDWFACSYHSSSCMCVLIMYLVAIESIFICASVNSQQLTQQRR